MRFFSDGIFCNTVSPKIRHGKLVTVEPSEFFAIESYQISCNRDISSRAQTRLQRKRVRFTVITNICTRESVCAPGRRCEALLLTKPLSFSLSPARQRTRHEAAVAGNRVTAADTATGPARLSLGQSSHEPCGSSPFIRRDFGPRNREKSSTCCLFFFA